jgi:hypothetical protein
LSAADSNQRLITISLNKSVFPWGGADQIEKTCFLTYFTLFYAMNGAKKE